MLTVTLLVQGRGSDPDAFQPNRDETQWWNRRDALVRCVASLLPIELILLFDEDWAQMHMTTNCGCSVLPKEQVIVGLWKRAAANPKETVTVDGLSCRLIPSSSGAGASSLSCGPGESKRDILEHLQKICSIDFLRKHRLNSSTDVLLRKTNKKALQTVWTAWTKEQSTNSGAPQFTTALEGILESILKKGGSSDKIVGVLHESSANELPVWDTSEKNTPSPAPTHAFLFLGAVRDMTQAENRTLQAVCQRMNIPSVKVRLGPVAEFTSKILSLVAFHHANDRLLPALRALSSRKRPREEACVIGREPSSLHFIVCVQKTAISTELSERDTILWTLVRCVVVALWRSRLVGKASQESTVLQNRMTLVLSDGKTLSLSQESLVKGMAERHQAAPCEFQILSELAQRLSTTGAKDLSEKSIHQNKAVLLPPGLPPPTTLLDIEMTERGAVDSFATSFYNSSLSTGAVHAAVLIRLGDSEHPWAEVVRQSFPRRVRSVRLGEGIDRVASSIGTSG